MTQINDKSLTFLTKPKAKFPVNGANVSFVGLSLNIAGCTIYDSVVAIFRM